MFQKFKTWHSGLTQIAKIGLWSATTVIAGSAISVAANPAPSTPLSHPNSTVSQEASRAPKITKKTVSETSDIMFAKTTIKDPNLDKGRTEIRTAGVNGVKSSTYEVTYEDGVEVSRKLLSEEVTTAPVTEVTAIGTYVEPEPSCDSNYSGGCVPIASDVDCAGGSGNGPAYISGPIYVTGFDIYDLDRDGDGVACE